MLCRLCRTLSTHRINPTFNVVSPCFAPKRTRFWISATLSHFFLLIKNGRKVGFYPANQNKYIPVRHLIAVFFFWCFVSSGNQKYQTSTNLVDTDFELHECSTPGMGNHPPSPPARCRKGTGRGTVGLLLLSLRGRSFFMEHERLYPLPFVFQSQK